MEKIRQVPVDDIVKQYETLRELVKKHATEDQVANILSMFDDFEERITSSPASGRLNYHNCFVGGFLDHVLRVQETAFKCKSLLKSMNIKINCSDSDIFFAAVFHDWGKLGTVDEPYYIQQTSSWHQEKLGEYWKHNDKLDYMSVTDRALFTLQSYDIKVNQNVWKAIKLSDGVFDDGNGSYYKRPSESDDILYYIVHWADWMSTVVEKQHYVQKTYNTESVSEEVKNLRSQFNDLFPKEDS